MSDPKDNGPVDTGAHQEDVQIAERQAAETATPEPVSRETPEQPESPDPQEPEAPEQATEDEPAHAEAGKPLPRGVQRRLNTLTRRNGEAYARIQELEQ